MDVLTRLLQPNSKKKQKNSLDGVKELVLDLEKLDYKERRKKAH